MTTPGVKVHFQSRCSQKCQNHNVASTEKPISINFSVVVTKQVG